MATLAKDKPRTMELTGAHPDYNAAPIIANDIVFAGAAVGESGSDGTARPLAGGDNFMGFAVEKCDNTGGSAADKLVKLVETGKAWLPVTGGDNINDYGVAVYASDDDTFTLTSTSANTKIGWLIRYDAGRSQCLVRFAATYMQPS